MFKISKFSSAAGLHHLLGTFYQSREVVFLSPSFLHVDVACPGGKKIHVYHDLESMCSTWRARGQKTHVYHDLESMCSTWRARGQKIHVYHDLESLCSTWTWGKKFPLLYDLEIFTLHVERGVSRSKISSQDLEPFLQSTYTVLHLFSMLNL
jgi:hypothetical protein